MEVCRECFANIHDLSNPTVFEVGIDIVLSKLGFMLRNLCLSGLLFADDFVLIALTAQGLKTLLNWLRKDLMD